jgi:hypothetical protein
LQIWIHGRQFENSQDYWDGNWLQVTAHCGAAGADVWTTGPIVDVPAIQGWHTASKQLLETLKGEARLECFESELGVILKAESLGHIKMEVFITPDFISQQHSFLFEIDQSYLNLLIAQCQTILKRYPIRGSQQERGR